MAIRYVNKGTWLKALFHTAPYLSVILRARFFRDTLCVLKTWKLTRANLTRHREDTINYPTQGPSQPLAPGWVTKKTRTFPQFPHFLVLVFSPIFPHILYIFVNIFLVVFLFFFSQMLFFFPHVGLPGSQLTHPGSPWLHHTVV